MRLLTSFRLTVMPVLVIAMTFCVHSGAATRDGDSVALNRSIPDCTSDLPKSLNYFRTANDLLSKQPIGFKCQVAGRAWEKTDKSGFGEAWKDLATGIIWSENLGGATNSGSSENNLVVDSDAAKVCRSIGGELPEISDFVIAQGNFGPWILPHLAKSQNAKYRDDSFVYWTKTVFNKTAYVYDAVNGTSNLDLSTRASIRCISR